MWSRIISFLRRGFLWIWLVPRRVVCGVIWGYQKTLSPDHGFFRVFFPEGYCKYYPSCSEYTRQVIMKDGLVVGLLRGLWRVLRCNPFSKGGIDKP